MVVGDSMGPDLLLVGARFSNFLLGKLFMRVQLRVMSIFHEIQMIIFRYCVSLQSPGWVGRADSPTCTV